MFVPDKFWHAAQVKVTCCFTFDQNLGVSFRGILLRLGDIVNMWIDEGDDPESVSGVVYTNEGPTPDINSFERSLWLYHYSVVDHMVITPVALLKTAPFTWSVVVAKSMVEGYPEEFHVLVLGRVSDRNSDNENEAYAGLLVRSTERRGSYRRIRFCT